MTVYVDTCQQYDTPAWNRSGLWCHMMSEDLDELHAMAAKISLKRSYFQDKNPRFPHYDLVPSKRALAVKLGVVEVTPQEMVMRFRDLFPVP